jgi:hypothetical protein
MAEKSKEQEKRLSFMIDKIFPNLAGKGRLMGSLSDGNGDFSSLAELSDSEIEEMFTMEKKYLGI